METRLLQEQLEIKMQIRMIKEQFAKLGEDITELERREKKNDAAIWQYMHDLRNAPKQYKEVKLFAY